MKKTKQTAPSSGKQAKKKGNATSQQPTDDESISSSGSETGWNSDEDHVFVNLQKGHQDRYYNDEEDDYDDDDCEGGLLLSDILTKNVAKAAKKSEKEKKKQQQAKDSDDEEEPASSSSKKKQTKTKAKVLEEELPSEEENDDDAEDDMMMDDDEDDDEEDSDDDEDDDDEDMMEDDDEEDNEDDEDEDGEEDDDEEDDDEEDDEDDEDEEQHSKLLKAIGRFSDVAGPDGNHNKVDIRSQMLAESSMMHDEGLTMSALLGGIQDSKGISAVKASLEQLEKTKAAPKYVEKVIANRMERKETYQGTKAEMDKWHETVLTNRNLPTLDLANDKRQQPRVKELITKFQPQTALEREIQMVMIQSGSTEEAIEKKEMDMLQSRNISMEEIKERQDELSKVNALMFYEQMKRHRINKIKSKAFRAIKRKQKKREQSKNGDVEEEVEVESGNEEMAEIDEKNAFDRVKERMDLKHKNTSKWARMALSHGHTDKSLRDAYHESVRMGHELTKKMHEKVNQRDGDEEHEGGEYDDNDGTLDQAKSEFQDAFDQEDNTGSLVVQGKYKKLFEMDFMKKAADQQKQRAREEAQQVLKDIAAMEQGYDSDAQDEQPADQRRKFDPKVKQDAKDAMSSLLGGNSGNGFQLNFAKGAAVTSSAKPNNNHSTDNVQSTGKQSASQHIETAPVSNEGKGKKKAKKSKEVQEEADSANPWLDLTGASGNSVGKQRGSHQLGIKNKALVDGDQVLVSVSTPATAAATGKQSNKRKALGGEPSSAVEDSNKKETANPKAFLSNKTQDDLVKMAFAGPDLEAEFAHYKDQEIDRELGIDDKKTKILKDVKAGWGDWAGPGGMEVSKKIIDKRNRLMVQVQKESETKKLDRQDNKMSHVMISERRITNNSKYKVAEVPYPFRSREEYERSLQMPVGEEWNAANAVTQLTQPEIKKRAGRIIEPIKLDKRAITKGNNAAANKRQKTK